MSLKSSANSQSSLTKMVPAADNSTPLLGNLSAFRKNAVTFLITLARQAPIVKIRFGWISRFIINDAEFARHILLENYGNYVKDQRLVGVLEKGTGPVLATSDGPEWQWRRRMMQPTFKPKNIVPFTDTIVEETDHMLGSWKMGGVVDVSEAMKTLTMNIIGRTMFSIDFKDEESSQLHHAYTDFGHALVARATQVVSIPLWVPSKTNRKFLAAVKTMETVLKRVIEQRCSAAVAPHDLLEMLINSGKTGDSQGFTERQLIHEMSAIVFAGHETTASTLTWALYLLSQHPDVLERLQNEITSVLLGNNPDWEYVKKMPYLQQVIDETMRLYPALYVNSRQAVADDRLGEYPLGAGSRALINIIGIHRNPRYWDAPDTFNPDRFSPENSSGRHLYAFIPFLSGPRRCLGAPMALLELQLILPMVLQRFSLLPVQGKTVVAKAGAVLQPENGLPMVVGIVDKSRSVLAPNNVEITLHH